MDKEFNFETWCSEEGLRPKTVTFLKEEDLNDFAALSNLNDKRAQLSMLEPNRITLGEINKLEKALDKLFVVKQSAVREIPSGSQADGSANKISGQTAIPSGSSLSGAVGGGDLVESGDRSTTSSLCKDADVNAKLLELLGESSRYEGIKDLLKIGEAKDVVAKDSGESPCLWLISDYLDSSLGVAKARPSTSKVKDTSKTDISADEEVTYNSIQWAGASNRIVLAMFKKDVAIEKIKLYIQYAAMISDYLELYLHSGVFQLDIVHRKRVGYEDRSWVDVSEHDVRTRLRYNNHSSSSNNQSFKSKGKKSQTKICIDYNRREGCMRKHCKYSHMCGNQGCSEKHPAYSCSKQQQSQTQ